MDVEELESVVDAMAEECGDQIDALYDTITLNKDTYNGFICRLREVVRLAKNEQEKSAPVGNSAALREAVDYLCERMADMDATFDPSEVECLRAALSAPPRNCDRFGSYAEARAEWWKTEVLPRVAGVVSGTEQPFDEWLFAPAKKGGAK